MASRTQAPLVFWVVVGVLLVWSLAGVAIYVAYFVETPQEFAHGAEIPANREGYASYVASIPPWAVAVGIIAAVARLLGTIALLRRKACAQRLYLVSLLFFGLALFRAFVLADAAAVMSTGHIATEGIFMGLNLFAVWFVRRQTAAGVLG